MTFKPSAPLGWPTWQAKEAAENAMRYQAKPQYIDKHGIVRGGVPVGKTTETNKVSDK